MMTFYNKSLLILGLGILGVQGVLATNMVPEIENLQIKVNSKKHEINLTFDVVDMDNNQVKVWGQLVHADGTTTNLEIRDKKYRKMDMITVGRGIRVIGIYPELLSDLTSSKIRLMVDDLVQVELEDLVHQVSEENLRELSRKFYGERNYTSGLDKIKEVKELILTSFIEKGLSGSMQDVPFGEITGHNIIGELKGSMNQKKKVLLVAHLDTVEDSPGADDNGSGLAGMMEVMRVLSHYNFNHSLQFIALDVEELGLIGSKQYVTENKSEIMAVVNYDMIGYYSHEPNSQFFPPEFGEIFPEAYQTVSDNEFKADFVLCMANDQSELLMKNFEQSTTRYVGDLKLVTMLIPEDGHIAPHAFRASDHAPFWDADIPALSIGDTADVRNSHYHSSSDTLETLDFSIMSQVVQSTIALLAEIAEIQHSSKMEVGLTDAL